MNAKLAIVAAVAVFACADAKPRECPDKRIMSHLTTLSGYSSVAASLSSMLVSVSSALSESGVTASQSISSYLANNPTFTSAVGEMSSMIASVTSEYSLTSVTATPLACMGRGPKGPGKPKAKSKKRSSTASTTTTSTTTTSSAASSSNDSDDDDN